MLVLLLVRLCNDLSFDPPAPQQVRNHMAKKFELSRKNLSGEPGFSNAIVSYNNQVSRSHELSNQITGKGKLKPSY